MFVSERGAPFSKRGFQAMLERPGEAAGFEMKIHPHMKSIQHTVRYPSWRLLGSRTFFGTDAAVDGRVAREQEQHKQLPGSV